MGLFDKLKGAVQDMAEDMKGAYEEAMLMDLHMLCDAVADMSKLDPKLLAYRGAINEKCNALSDEEVEEFYKEVKKMGSLFKRHPMQEMVEANLVERNMYVRQEDGTVVKNSMYKLFK